MTTNLIVTISASCGIILGFVIAVLATWLDRVLYRRERQRTEMLKELTKVKYDFPDCPGVLDRVREELRNTEGRCRENAEVER